MSLLDLPGLRAFRQPGFRVLVLAIVVAGAVARLAIDVTVAAQFHDFRTGFVGAARIAWRGVSPYHSLPPAATGVFDAGDPTKTAVATPIFLLLFWPFMAMPDGAAVGLWTALSLAAAVGTVAAVWAGIGRPAPAEALAVLGLVLLFPPLRDSLQEGQVSIFIGLAAALALLAHQRGQPAWGGAALGVAVAIKLTPALLLLYFAWKRDWRLIAWTLGVALALAAATLPLGWAGYWPGFMAVTSEMGRGTANLLNQSLNGFLMRWFLPDRTGLPVAPPPAAFSAGLAVAQLAVVAAVVAALRWSRVAPPRGPRLASVDGGSPQEVERAAHPESEWAELSVLLLAMGLVQPFAWPHHYAQALSAIPVAVRLVRAQMLRRPAAVTLLIAYLAVLILAFPLFTMAHTVDPGSLPSRPLLDLGASLLMLAAAAAGVALAGACPAPGVTVASTEVAAPSRRHV